MRLDTVNKKSTKIIIKKHFLFNLFNLCFCIKFFENANGIETIHN